MFARSFTGSVLLVGWPTHHYRTVTFFGPPFQVVRESVGWSLFARRY